MNRALENPEIGMHTMGIIYSPLRLANQPRPDLESPGVPMSLATGGNR